MYAEYTRPQLTFLALVPCVNILWYMYTIDHYINFAIGWFVVYIWGDFERSIYSSFFLFDLINQIKLQQTHQLETQVSITEFPCAGLNLITRFKKTKPNSGQPGFQETGYRSEFIHFFQPAAVPPIVLGLFRWKFWVISITWPTFNQLEQVVQLYRLCKANRDSTPNKILWRFRVQSIS